MNKTGIQYLDFTWNPVTGCTKGCPECWAREVSQKRLAIAYQVKYEEALTIGVEGCGPVHYESKRLMDAYRTFAPTLHPERLDQPARRKKSAVIGVCFMGDWMDKGLDAKPILRVMWAADKAPQHTYIFLTKQPERMAIFLLDFKPRENWYLGFSARNQAEFDAGWPHMAKLAAAGWKVWVSLEPMQEEIDIDECPGCGWDCDNPECPIGPASHSLSTVIVGAQSGKNSVPFQENWAHRLQDQCRIAKIPFMFKQGHDERGKVVTLPELDGVQHKALAWNLATK